MSSKDYKKIAFYPNRKISPQKLTRRNAELDERKNVLTLWHFNSSLLTEYHSTLFNSDTARLLTICIKKRTLQQQKPFKYLL